MSATLSMIEYETPAIGYRNKRQLTEGPAPPIRVLFGLDRDHVARLEA